MAKSISEEELQLRKRARRRLIGAIALVTIVGVFLPMVLEHDPKPVKQDVSIQIPSPNSGIFTSKIEPVVPGAPGATTAAKRETAAAPKSIPAPGEPPKVAAVPSAAKPAAAAPTPPAHDTEAAPAKKPVPEKPRLQAKPAVKPPAKSAPVAKPADTVKAASQAKPDAKGAAGFVVQVAALNDADKAKQMQEQIAAAGFKCYTEIVPTAKGNVTRVRAGPFASRDEAEAVRDKLKGMGISGNIVPK